MKTRFKNMMYKKSMVIAASCFSMFFAHAQTSAPNDLPVVVPPSPELASLAKIGELSAGLHTGAANVNIPLFQMTAGSIRLPIALSYSTNGIRVNDIASRVGLGWNLVAGGNISRTIHDEDDLTSTWLAPPASFTIDDANTALYTYLFTANQDNYDTEKDEYSFSVNGLSGKFFIDNDGIPRLMGHSNIKIEKTGSIFLLTDVQGTKYYFGGSGYEEKTRSYTTNGVGRENKISQTGWFLQKIVTPEGDNMMFSYAHVILETIQGPSQSMILTTAASEQENALTCNITNPCRGQWKAVMMNEVKYDTYYLTQVASSSGQIAYFTYNSRGDAGGDVRLTDLKIDQAATSITSQLKKYHFEYQDFNIVADKNQRFYLKKLFTYSNNLVAGVPDETQVHEFDYNDQDLPSQKSLGQDYYGYANNKANTGFAPRPNPDPYIDHNGEIADRSSVFSGIIKGSLNKVTYPTGGYEKFNYEQHTKAEQAFDSSFTVDHLQKDGILNTGIAQIVSTTFTTASDPFTQPVLKATITSTQNIGQTPVYLPIDAHYILSFELQKLDGTGVGSIIKFKTYTSQEVNYQGLLQPNTTYKAILTVFGNSTHGDVNLEYNPILTSRWDNTPAAGMRVSSIESFDPVSNKKQNKYYKYASITDITKSTGDGILTPDCSGNYRSGGLCVNNPNGSGTYGYQITCDNLAQFSSSSLSGTFTFGGSPIAYKDVIESDDPNFVNGGVQHSFYTSYNNSRPQAMIGIMMPACPQSLSADMNGTELETQWFKKAGATFTVLKKTENNYSFDNRISYIMESYVNRKKWTPPSSSLMSEKVMPFDCGKYRYTSSWFHLDNTVNTEYDQAGLNPMVSTTSYEYNNTAHTLPTKITTTNSKGETILQESKYPADYATAPYTAMVTKHILSPVVEAKSTKAGSVLAIVKTDYTDWGGTGTVYRPQIVNMQKGTATAEPRLHYYALQSDGSPLEVAKEDGMHVSYIWDYLNNFPIAEIKNATKDEIAYSSFETDGRGNWTVMGTLLPVGSTDLNTYWTTYSDGFTGTKSYGGKLSKTVSSSQNYTITLWSKSTANTPTVNAVSGTLLQTKNGWKLFRWNITGVTTITVQGNQVDEVRLHPVKAMMTSYTYFPFVGASSVSDAADNVQYYEYDGMNRLLRIRDIDQNILKQYEYKYNQAIAPCANTAVNWQPTGMVQCVTDANNNFTGVKQQQERDENNCSSTYLQTRWVTIATPTGECVPMAGCSGPDKRWIGTPPVCTTGTKVLVSSVKVGTTWYCTWKYTWSDGYESPAFQTSGTTRCFVPIEL